MNEEPAPTVVAPPPGLWARVCHGEMQCVAELAKRFWLPAYVWLRASGDSAEATPRHCARFFSKLCAGDPPARDDISAARFREYVIARLREDLAAGFPMSGSAVVVQVDADKGERSFASAPVKTEEDVFDRRWALSILSMAMRAVRNEYAVAGKASLFDALKPFLAFNPDDSGYSKAGKVLDMSGSAFHMQVFSFRKRYRALLRAEIADTVRHSDDVDSELTALLVAAS